MSLGTPSTPPPHAQQGEDSSTLDSFDTTDSMSGETVSGEDLALDSSFLNGANRAWIEEIYAAWLENSDAVDPSWHPFFQGLSGSGTPSREALLGVPPDRRSLFAGRSATTSAPEDAQRLRRNAAVGNFIAAFRRNGHLIAHLDPLGLRKREKTPVQLTMEYHGLVEADLDRVFHAGHLSPSGTGYGPLRAIIARCKATYCGSIGVEFVYIRDEHRKKWIEERIEETGGRILLDHHTALRVLDRLTAADHFESFLHTKYPGAKRFSIEGCEALIPLLDLMISAAAQEGVDEVDIGMAHRGRLNVLANILGKAHRDIFEEFEDRFAPPEDMGSGGDVKYHLGYQALHHTPEGKEIHVNLAFNPSHLEFVSPVVNGMVRAKQDHTRDDRRVKSLPIALHGDAAFAGQGIVQETINLAELPGYTTGGTIHVVINNQVGFTTPPELQRSSEHCTDVVKSVLAPVIHVNSEDLGAVAFVARLAVAYRQTFHRDIVIDLWGYRKYGHNESDEPAFTQPLMYQEVRKHLSPLQIYAQRCVAEGVLSQADVTGTATRIRALLEEELSRAREPDRPKGVLAGLWKGIHPGTHEAAASQPTQVSAPLLAELGEALARVPDGFAVHPKLKKILDKRAEMGRGEAPIDYAMGEALAHATLLREGYPVRLSGQDSGRGTFSHRNAVLHHQTTGERYIPLNHLGGPQAMFDVLDSPLSEAAVLGFEYGYTLARPEALVMWEAQFGDFANGAQVIIDQFICSCEDKWNRFSGLVLLLPHGYEGQGPEHSSARLERFLQLSAEDNWRVMNLTTPAQLFHALRSQVHRNFRKPLVLMTPKSLLRHPRMVSSLTEFTETGFQPVMGDGAVDHGKVTRGVLCSGKVYYDLLQAREEQKLTDVALLRVEQLYPFPEDEVREAISLFPKAGRWTWCQEEPANMGGYSHVAPHLMDLLGTRIPYAGRSRSAAPATGSKRLHDQEHADLLKLALFP